MGGEDKSIKYNKFYTFTLNSVKDTIIKNNMIMSFASKKTVKYPDFIMDSPI
ncbi:MAG: hypothetical protein Kow0042_08220 [Calditrichia bacterium]